MSESINFDEETSSLTVEIPVIYKGKNYLLREANGEASCKWRNMQLANTIFENGKPKSVGANFADIQLLLVALCLFEENEKTPGEYKSRPVGLEVVKQLPTRLVSRLYDRVMDISGLSTKPQVDEEGDGTEAKND